MPETQITIGVCPTSKQGVAIAAYSGKHSRMWTWDSSTLEVLGYQDVKARVKLRDVSPNGSYCAYYAEAHRKSEHYVAICRPPYFHALWLRNTFHLGHQVVLFRADGTIRHCLSPKTEELPWSRIIEERLLENPPFQFEAMQEDSHRSECELYADRCSGIAEYCDHWHWRTPSLPHWVGHDPRGRRITVRGDHLQADGVTFLDCRRMPFEAISPPNWALEWGDER